MMQSSPPNRPWKGPSSPSGSQYSLNLDALDLDAISDDLGEIQRPNVERIQSEDIDGPSDFTQNMGQWLRGSIVRRQSPKVPRKTTKSVPEAANEEHAGDERPLLLDATHEDEVNGEYTQPISHHTPTGTPPRVSILQQTKDEDQFSSEFVPHAMTSTPFPPMLQHLLQPTVEDFHSELMSASRQPRFSHFFQSPMSATQKHSPSKDTDNSSEFNLDMDPVERPRDRVRVVGEQDGKSWTIRELQAKCEQLQNSNAALQKAVQQERTLRDQENIAHQFQMAEALKHASQGPPAAESAYAKEISDDFRPQLNEKKQQESTSPDADLSDKAMIDRLRDQLAMQTSKYDRQIQEMQHNLLVAQNGRHEAEELSRVYREELEEGEEKHRAEMDRFMIDTNEAQNSKAIVLQLEESLRLANIQIGQLKSTSHIAQLDLKRAQLQLQSVKDTDDVILSRITGERLRAVELATSLQQQLEDLQQSMRESQAKADADLSTAQNGQSQHSEASRLELDVVRAEYEAKVSELNEAVLDRDEALDALQKCQAELNIAKSRFAEITAVNAAMDGRVSDALRKRELFWREKLAEADRERQIMAKALMHQWGREELGVQQPQLYAYKHCKSSGKKNSSA